MVNEIINFIIVSELKERRNTVVID